MQLFAHDCGNDESHPSRVRGLKLPSVGILKLSLNVAPFTGAWIEIKKNMKN